MTSTAVTDPLMSAVAAGVRHVELGHPYFTGMPCSPNHPGFRMTLIRRHGDMVRPVDAYEAQAGGRFKDKGAEQIPFMMTRGILLDIAGLHGVDTLPAGYAITEEDLQDAAKAAGVTPRRGDVVLVRSGWARHFDNQDVYLGQTDGVPGPSEEAAQWLADFGIAATGSDTTAYEHIPAGKGHSVLPVHRILLVQNGIHIIERLNLEDAAAQELTEFTFVMSPLRIVGGTGSPVRPMAVVSA